MMDREKNRLQKLLFRVIPYAVLIAAYLFSVGIYAYLGTHNLDADRSSEMVLADLLNSEKAFLSENWYYSTELRVVSAVPVYQLGLLLFDTWHMARTFSIAVLLLGVAGSFLFFMRGIGIRDAAIYAAACLILPVSWLSMFMLVYGQFYSAYFILICVLLGLLIRLKNKERRTIKLIALIMLSVYGGMQGVRLLMICAAPLMISCGLLLLLRMRSCCTIREGLRTEEGVYGLGALVICAGLLAGYLINAQVLSRIYEYKSFSQTLMYSLDWEEVGKQINYLPKYFGYTDGVQLISIDGLVNALSLGVIAAVVISACMLIAGQDTLCAGEKLAVWFPVCSVLIGIVVNSVTIYGNTSGIGSVSYYLPGLMLLISLAFMLVEKSFVRAQCIRTMLLLMMTAVFMLNSVQYIRKNFRVADADYELTAQWLVDNGYTTGFATFWNANLLTEATDGKLDVYTYQQWDQSELYKWLQKKEHFGNLPEGKVFVFVEKAEKTDGYVPLAREENLVMQTNNGWIYGYDSAQEVVQIQREAFE